MDSHFSRRRRCHPSGPFRRLEQSWFVSMAAKDLEEYDVPEDAISRCVFFLNVIDYGRWINSRELFVFWGDRRKTFLLCGWQEDKVEILVLLDNSSWAFQSMYNPKPTWDRIISEAVSRSWRPTTMQHSSCPAQSSPLHLEHSAGGLLYETVLIKHIEGFVTCPGCDWQHQCLLVRNSKFSGVHTL